MLNDLQWYLNQTARWNLKGCVQGAKVIGIMLCINLLIGSSALPDTRLRRPQASNWKAILVAGDPTLPVFDNAVRSVENWLLANGLPENNIRRLGQTTNPFGEPADLAHVMTSVAFGGPSAASGCFIFVTSHGVRDSGLSLYYAGEVLRPADLAEALSIGCANIPTVVIVSGCFSGLFTTGSMPAPNRIILTAARPDRMSFGCQAGRTFTAFDQCLLAALPTSMTWRVVFDTTVNCVNGSERALREIPSMPQANFGSEVRNLAVHF
jgi:hypothetical protein